MDDATAEFLQAFLTQRDVACPGCGYNLRDLQGQRCPECGNELKLSIGLVEPKQAAGIAGLVGLAAGAGMSGLLLAYILIRGVVFHDSLHGVDKFVILTLGGFVIEGAAVWIWLRNWGRIRRLDTRARWIFAVACWLLTLVNLGTFSAFIR
jgi:hypothetical protein